MSDESIGTTIGKGISGTVIGLGILLLCAGIVLYLLPFEEQAWWGGTQTEYPLRGMGITMLIIGIIMTIVGAVGYAMSAAASGQESQKPTIIVQQPINQPVMPIIKNEYCENCGRAIPFDSIFCPYCMHKRREN